MAGRKRRKEGQRTRRGEVMSRQEIALVLCQSLSHQHGHPESSSSQQLAESLNEGGLASSGRTRHPESEGRSQLAQQMSPPTRENLCQQPLGLPVLSGVFGLHWRCRETFVLYIIPQPLLPVLPNVMASANFALFPAITPLRMSLTLCGTDHTVQ